MTSFLEVKNSHISDDHDYASYLINNASHKLNIKCVPARRSSNFHAAVVIYVHLDQLKI